MAPEKVMLRGGKMPNEKVRVKMKKSISIVIPAYNEEKRIGKTIANYVNNLEKLYKDKSYELIIVPNGCTDQTLKILNDLRKNNRNIKIFEFKEKLGKGGSIIEGLKNASGDIIGFVDADDSFDILFLKSSIQELENSSAYHGFIASKWKHQRFGDVDEPFLRKIMSRAWNFFVRIFINLRYCDTQAGAKFFRKNVIDSVVHDLKVSGFAFDAELLFKIRNKGFIVEEVFIPSRHVEGSTFRYKHIFPMFKDLVAIALRMK